MGREICEIGAEEDGEGEGDGAASFLWPVTVWVSVIGVIVGGIWFFHRRHWGVCCIREGWMGGEEGVDSVCGWGWCEGSCYEGID